jgi:hypothetical protein
MEVHLMSQKFSEMSRQELREYILKNRDDNEALHIYLDRALAEPGTIYPAPQSIDDLKNFPLPKNSAPHS